MEFILFLNAVELAAVFWVVPQLVTLLALLCSLGRTIENSSGQRAVFYIVIGLLSFLWPVAVAAWVGAAKSLFVFALKELALRRAGGHAVGSSKY